MSIEILEKFLSGSGWEKDRFGHYKKDTKTVAGVTVELRVKMQATSARLEKKVFIVDKNEWRRIDTAYYSQIQILEGNRLLFGKTAIKGQLP